MTQDTKNGSSKLDLKTPAGDPDLRITLISHKYALQAKLMRFNEAAYWEASDLRTYNFLKSQYETTSEIITNYTYAKARDHLMKLKLSK